ncbi:hypothetical protein JDV02_002269 [Purpureocillium takamizusanense]|uniref:Flo11 n=1 Tax=Purpureocillium takamizusanense TaxID=2060973 RepID=A0A9Q8V8G1_9HYPO|nr:uncharacterized protein JDV02_002269 [Purpureocillium takamizusanense]UNI15767.1 hypothetical protein JDV02_002269 [Purpureocillium takamizusanense]
MAMISPTTDATASRPASTIASPRHVRSRTQSISSDRPSTIGFSLGLTAPPVFVSPEPAFIAGSAASQIVTNDHDGHADSWYDQNGVEPPSETALVTPAALQLVNGFLDQLLFNFLQVSKSTNLSALRPAVSEILKPKLAKDTISNADEELREYLGGSDEEDFTAPANPRNWDAELVWKRTRLRCMVYSSLGDMEEEDEDIYMEQENLEIGAHEPTSDVVSPAVAIFLTSVLEYMGELTLTVAGQAAYQRVRANIVKGIKNGTRSASDVADRIVVCEMDMERVALDRTLGRLWRGWKKRVRSPDTAVRPASRGSNSHSKQDIGSPERLAFRSALSDATGDQRRPQDRPDDTIVEDVHPADIPLPMGDHDVDEIEVPGLAPNSDDEDEPSPDEKPVRRRPKSLSITPFIIANGLPTPTTSQPHTPVITAARKRSTSLPTPVAATFHASRQAKKASNITKTPCTEGKEETQGETCTGDNEASSSGDGYADTRANILSKPGDTVKVQKATLSNRPAAVESRDCDSSDYEDAEEVAFEKAEIVTSSRVSINGSSSSSASESGKTSPTKRPSSVHSARIVDVPRPRSPSHSRATSLDMTERNRAASLSSAASRTRPPSSQDERKPKYEGQPPTHAEHMSQSLVEKKSPRQVEVAIPESEEDSGRLKPSESPESIGRAISPPGPAVPDVLGSQSRRDYVAPSAFGKKPPSFASNRDHPPPSLKVSTSRIVSSGPFIDETIPEIPQKSPVQASWQSPKAESRGMHSMERYRTKETDDDLSLPMQSNVAPRQIHTSASSASSGTSRLKPVRTSEDSSSRAESVARNFEQLIQSNQTITYTLTPENMRDIDSKRSIDSPVVTKFSRRSDDVRGQSSPRTPTIPDIPRSPVTQQPKTPTSPRAVEGKGSRPPGPLSRSPPGVAVSTGRVGSPKAREARVPRESISDFAEFIKSTGPAGDRSSVRKPSVPTPSGPVINTMPARQVSAASTRGRHQPREAAVDTRNDNSDLIDFIRQGPPIATSGHRIPRHVAPFRTTMDSDQMSGAIGGKAVDATIPEIRYSQASTSVTDNSMPSMQSSINSSSALLRNKVAPGPGMGVDDQGMMPQRKQRRVRDPYSIDFSDDENDEAIVTTKPPARKEESLAEFLRNYDPPPEPPSSPPRLPKKKASAPSLIGRFTRGGNKDKDVGANKSSLKPESRSLHSRSSSGKGGHIPLQVNMPSGYDKYGASDGVPGRPRMTSTASAGRVPRKKFEPREAVSTRRTETSELAAFLRDSAPPDAGLDTRLARASSHREESNGFAKMFGRKKKIGVS